MLLVIESSSQAWYLVYGGGLRTYAENNDALAALLKDNLDTDFFQGESDAGFYPCSMIWSTGARRPFLFWMTPPRNRATCSYRTTIKFRFSPLAMFLLGILFTLLVNIWWIILLLVVLNLIDRHRFREYITTSTPGSLSIPRSFPSPALLWHGQGLLVLVPPYAVPDDRGPLRGRRRFRGRRRPAGPRWGPAARRERLHRPGRMWGRRPQDSRGDPQGSVPPGAPRPLGNVEPPLGHGVGMGCTCSRTKSAACSVGGACSPPFFWIPWAEVSSFPGFFCSLALKGNPTG